MPESDKIFADIGRMTLRIHFAVLVMLSTGCKYWFRADGCAWTTFSAMKLMHAPVYTGGQCPVRGVSCLRMSNSRIPETSGSCEMRIDVEREGDLPR